jgi:hypothetical protein
MSVKAMKVVSAREHPNATNLRMYEFAIDDKTLTVIANLENVYQVGDIVAVAMLGSIMVDGTKISKVTLRGLGSFGMALGKVDAPLGTDLTRDYCHPDYTPDLTTRHVKWPDIELFHNIVQSMEKRKEFLGDEFKFPKVIYYPKVKLHGCNGAVQIAGGDITAQSREAILENGGRGFYEWVMGNRQVFLSKSLPGKHLTIFGEWCGPGVQKNVAISKIDHKVFIVFGAQIGLDQDAVLEVRPEKLRELTPEHPDIFVLPWHDQISVCIDFAQSRLLS